MDLRNLRALVEVVRQGGFSQAAVVLFATQSTVSKAVRQLEDEVGMPLLDRIGHKSTLTPVGEAVYRRAVRMLTEREDLLTELDDLRGLKRGTCGWDCRRSAAAACSRRCSRSIGNAIRESRSAWSSWALIVCNRVCSPPRSNWPHRCCRPPLISPGSRCAASR